MYLHTAVTILTAVGFADSHRAGSFAGLRTDQRLVQS